MDLPLRKTTRSKVIFLTYESASAMAKTDQGFGRGVFAIECRNSVMREQFPRDPDRAAEDYTLYFGIETL